MTTARFRVWDKEQKVWISDYLGFYITPEGKLFHEFYEGEDEVLREVHHTLEEVMFSTNLKDKNGIEIFEGDIVKWGHLNQWSREQPHRIAEVKFDPDIQFHSQVGVFNFGSFAYRDTTETDLEVIGNIHENPELIKEAQ